PHRQPKGARVPPEGLWQSLEEPDQRHQAMPPIAGLMDLAVSPRNQALQVTARVRLGCERVDFGQPGGGPFVEIMKPPDGAEIENLLGIDLHLVEQRFQFGPVGPFTGDEALEVDDHSGWWLVVIGYWLLAIGYWLLVVGWRLSVRRF